MKVFNKYIALVVATAILALGFRPAFATAPIPSTPNGGANPSTKIAWFAKEVITANATSLVFDISNLKACGTQYVVQQGSTPNTVTVAMKVSNDQANWVGLGASSVTAANILTASTTNQNDFYNLNLPLANYARIDVTAGNTQPVTLTLRSVCV